MSWDIARNTSKDLVAPLTIGDPVAIYGTAGPLTAAFDSNFHTDWYSYVWDDALGIRMKAGYLVQPLRVRLFQCKLLLISFV